MKGIYFYVVCLVVLISSLSNTGCAKKGIITGGSKDTIAPKIVNSTPKNYTTNYSGKTIKIYFNELIKVKDINKQLIISPPLKNAPIIVPQGSASKYISITFEDTLQDNTTYSLNFGQSITDNNEGNPYSQFKFVFSTGNVIDSLFLLGKIKDAYLQKSDNFVNIQLYDATTFTDSTIFKERPLYVTNTLDSLSVFSLENLKEGQYKIIALKDKNNNYIYDPKSDKIGFLEKTISIPNDTLFSIELFREQSDFSASKPSQENNNRFLIPFQGNPKNTNVVATSNGEKIDVKLTSYPQKEKDSLQLFFPEKIGDSISLSIRNDTFNKSYTFKIKTLKEKDTLNIESIQKGTLAFRDTLTLRTTTPLITFDTEKIKLLNKDSLSVPFRLQYDAFEQKIRFDFEKEENQKYELVFLPNAFVDFYSKSNDSISFKYSTKAKSDYGNLKLILKNVKRFPVLVELLFPDGKVYTKSVATDLEPMYFDAIEPKMYTIRLIYDDNNNGVWDTGNFLKKLQPEQVIYFPKGIDVRANWDWEQIFDVTE